MEGAASQDPAYAAASVGSSEALAGGGTLIGHSAPLIKAGFLGFQVFRVSTVFRGFRAKPLIP